MEKGIKAFEHQEWVSQRKVPHTIDVVDPDPSWPATYERLAAGIPAGCGRTSAICDRGGGGTPRAKRANMKGQGIHI
ncbi:hypothetical protein NLG97_g6473 [Lecanicillium saksenae]|uniref:Uncharacterized protein n=1 Tax=Lecanicillium saksenae TaxID=468837 RepID=A0ACC1QTC3_9HYPO|nr:hypothetical protein NLG97_g6473 [Lecanicillium saksenae]